jgi:pimeloyl-ACP methyl ester carboxylesterase
MIALLMAAGLPALSLLAQEKPGLLSGAYTPEVLASVLPAPGAWHPYPKAGDTAGWAKVPEAVRTAHVRLAEKSLGADWPAPKASVFLDFVRDGNRTRYEAVSFGRRVRLAEAVVAEAIEGKGRFVDDILDGIWTICEESFWGVPAHVGAQKRGAGLPDVTEPVVDLFAAETATLLAWTDYLVGDALDRASPLVRERIRLEIGRRVLTPCLERDDFWWMGFGERGVNNWNPWIVSNWLAASLLVEKDPARRDASVHKALRCLDAFLASYPADGGCDEGPGYWDRAGGSLFDCLELLDSASGGKIDVFDRPLVKEIGRYIGRVHIAGPWAVNFADAAAKPGGSASLIFRYGKAIGDQGMTGFGAWLAREQGLGKGAVGGSFGVLGRTLPALFGLEEILRTEPKEPLARDAWFPGLQVMAARSFEGSTKGLYLAAKGGHNDESHNHNDVGSFVVCADGEPVLIDVGVETYTAKTFSGRRYEIWTMQSAFHNLPTVGGVMQKNGRAFRARNVRYKADAARAELDLDIAPAYPPEAGISSWERRLVLERGKRVVVEERYALDKAGRPIVLSFMSLRRPEIAAAGRIDLLPSAGGTAGAALGLYYDGRAFTPAVETIEIKDDRLRGSWGGRVYRILLKGTAAGRTGTIKVRIEERKAMDIKIERKTCRATDGVELVYSAAGTGEPALVFIHGGLANRGFYDGQLKAFAPRHRVIALDLPGHGESGAGRTKWGIPEFGADVKAVIDAEKVDKVIIFGNSLGGPVAIEAGLLLPGRALGVVGIDTFQQLGGVFTAEEVGRRAELFEKDYAGSLKEMIGLLFHKDADPALVADAEKRMMGTPPAAAKAMFLGMAGYDMGAAAARLAAPIRTINGDLYPTDIEGNRKIKPDFEAVVMKHMGHYPMLERPGEFNRLVAETVAALTAKTR